MERYCCINSFGTVFKFIFQLIGGTSPDFWKFQGLILLLHIDNMVLMCLFTEVVAAQQAAAQQAAAQRATEARTQHYMNHSDPNYYPTNERKRRGRPARSPHQKRVKVEQYSNSGEFNCKNNIPHDLLKWSGLVMKKENMGAIFFTDVYLDKMMVYKLNITYLHVTYTGTKDEIRYNYKVSVIRSSLHSSYIWPTITVITNNLFVTSR